MNHTLFASDLHLAGERPAALKNFSALMEAAVGHVSTIYLLGDLVEFWLGDDDDDPVHRELVAILARLTSRGVTCAVMTGNRDFLMQQEFAAASGARLLGDFELITLGSTPTLLTHGDLLCLRDVQYQQFRAEVRAPQRQAAFLGMSLAERRQLAHATRAGTRKSMAGKDDYIMDVDEDEVTRIMRVHGAERLVHGHTHRPAVHNSGTARERVVLGDWYEGDLVYVHDGNVGQLCSAAELVARWR